MQNDPIPYRPGMTLMPGQSTVISTTIPISSEMAENIESGVRFEMVPVPPPTRTPVHDIGETLGLCRGIRAERRHSQYRCESCNKMQPAGSWMAWVPDGMRRSDPVWSFEEAARQNAYNGSMSGWCLKCAPKASRPIITSNVLGPIGLESEKKGFFGFFKWLFE